MSEINDCKISNLFNIFLKLVAQNMPIETPIAFELSVERIY